MLKASNSILYKNGSPICLWVVLSLLGEGGERCLFGSKIPDLLRDTDLSCSVFPSWHCNLSFCKGEASPAN